MSLHIKIHVALIASLLLGGCATAPVYLTPLMDAERMSWRADILIIDVRTPQEFADSHIAGSTNIPAIHIKDRSDELSLDKGGPILIYSDTGRAARWAAEILTEMGYRRVHTISGGYRAWIDAGFGFVSGPEEDWSHPE
jgi:phage shock protein E